MKNKYEFLNKEILQKDYSELGDFEKISLKYDIPRSTIERYCKVMGVIATAKTKYSFNEDIFETDTEKSFYLAGFIAADGCVLQNKCEEPNYISIALSKKDEDHLLMIKNLLEFSGPIKYILSKIIKDEIIKTSEQVRISIYSKKMIKDLERFEIGQRKSLTYSFPEWLKTHPLVHHFIRGYSDGDGSLFSTGEKRILKKTGEVKEYRKMNFTMTATQPFLYGMKEVFELNGISTISIPKNYTNNKISYLKYSGNGQVSKVANFLYKDATIFLDRKYNLIKEFL